ncbi:MAG: hypothetical protein IJ619_08050 [Eubacterium sp.]|nr:hypothetical protein [Eubacterium sp.]
MIFCFFCRRIISPHRGTTCFSRHLSPRRLCRFLMKAYDNDISYNSQKNQIREP